MMKRISLKARLSKTYTNHCVRASCITRLSSNGVPDSAIISTSGHKSVKSLATYNRTTEKQAAITAAVLDHDVVKQRSITAGAQTDYENQDDVDEAPALALPEQLPSWRSPTRAIPSFALPLQPLALYLPWTLQVLRSQDVLFIFLFQIRSKMFRDQFAAFNSFLPNSNRYLQSARLLLPLVQWNPKKRKQSSGQTMFRSCMWEPRSGWTGLLPDLAAAPLGQALPCWIAYFCTAERFSSSTAPLVYFKSANNKDQDKAEVHVVTFFTQ